MRFGAFIGAWEVALGRREGMARFGDTPQAFLASLAPWIAFPLVYAVYALVSGAVVEAIAFMLMTMVAQLTPPVVSHWLAVRWGREGEWLRYCTAYNWCQWVMVSAFVVMLIVTSVLLGPGEPDQGAVGLFLAAFAVFCLWLSWAVARFGLALSRGRAALLVVLINGATFVLVIGPHLVQLGVNGSG